MLIGVPKEVKNHEYRVGLISAAVRELALHGHQVFVEAAAESGTGSLNQLPVSSYQPDW